MTEIIGKFKYLVSDFNSAVFINRVDERTHSILGYLLSEYATLYIRDQPNLPPYPNNAVVKTMTDDEWNAFVSQFDTREEYLHYPNSTDWIVNHPRSGSEITRYNGSDLTFKEYVAHVNTEFFEGSSSMLLGRSGNNWYLVAEIHQDEINHPPILMGESIIEAVAMMMLNCTVK